MGEQTTWKARRGQTIDRLYAWVAEEADGGEGVIGAVVNGMFTPLIGADRERIESYRDLAKDTLRVFPSTRSVRLKVFANGKVIDHL